MMSLLEAVNMMVNAMNKIRISPIQWIRQGMGQCMNTRTLAHLGILALLIWVVTGCVDAVFAEGGGVLHKAEQSIAEIASEYYGSLTRPVFPQWSAFLPLPVQIGISIILVFLILIVTQIFPKARLMVMALTLFAVARQLIWRGADTLDFTNVANGVVGVIIYVAEIVSFLALILGYFQILKPIIRPSVPLPNIPPEQLPSVDIYVCSYNEPMSVLYRTLVGCNGIDYPRKQVYLLDDGNRPEMRELTQRLGVNYITRPENTHAKAGNLNNALVQTQGDLVLVFDADHVPVKSFLREVVGFFIDPKIAFVQTPQHFFTQDPVQRNLITERIVNNEQDLFFHVIQNGNDYWGATFFSGSGAIFRRQALIDIGGFAVETITEDVHTGLRLHAKGWKSAYYSKDLAAGLSQESYADFIKQRLRWGRGMTQILFFDNPLFASGLSLPQRLCYLSGIWYFFHGFPRLIFMIAPLFFLLFGFMTINAGYFEVMLYYIPSFLALFLGYGVLTYRIRDNFWSEVYETAFFVYLFLTTVATILSPARAKFRVTPKGTMTDRLNFNWRIVFPQMAISALIIIGIGMAFIRTLQTPDYIGGIYTNLFWSGYNLIILLASIYLAQERPQYRLSPRVDRSVSAELRLLDGTIAVGTTTNISESGIALVFEEPIPVAGTMALKLLDWDINETSIFYVQAVRSTVDGNNKHYVGCRVVNRTDEQHQKLIRHMFGSANTWLKDYALEHTGKTFLALLTTPFRLASATERAQKRRTPRFKANLQCVLEMDGRHFNGFSDDVSESGMSMFVQADQSLRLESRVVVHIQWSDGKISQYPAKIQRMEAVHRGQCKLGLNFLEVQKQQRLELIQNIYGARDSLIRVAPTVTRMVKCMVVRQSGEQVQGMTQEFSEMGSRISLGHPVGFQPNELVQITFGWEDGSQNTVQGMVIPDAQAQGGGGTTMALVYFKNLDLQTIDMFNQKLHAPSENQVFYSPLSFG